MELTIEQGFEYQENDWWKWWVWLDGSDEALDQVDHVIYKLHSTFPDPVRTVKDRSSKFRLDSAGWGGFVIRAKVVHKNKQVTVLKHELELRYHDGTVTDA
jgi:transcription initiation factor IIF auxiliary subunit